MNQSDSSAAGQPLTSRRTALKGLAAMATVQILPSYIALGGPKAPSNQLTKGIIGCGGISRSHLGMPGKLLALCDVDSKRLSARQAEAKIVQLGRTRHANREPRALLPAGPGLG